MLRKNSLTVVLWVLALCARSQTFCWVDTVHSCPNDTVTVNIKVTDLQGCGSFKLHLYYPNGSLELLSWQGNAMLQGLQVIIDEPSITIKYTGQLFSLPDSATIISLRFHHIQDNTCTINFDQTPYSNMFYDGQGQPVACMFNDGWIVSTSVYFTFKYYLSELPISGLTVTFAGDSAVTDQWGQCHFHCVPNGVMTFTMSGLWGGANATDALIIARHAVCLENVTDPVLFAAGDADNSGTLTANDSYMIMRRFTSNINLFKRPDWQNTSGSLIIYNQPAYYVIRNAICTGDVNASYTP